MRLINFYEGFVTHRVAVIMDSSDDSALITFFRYARLYCGIGVAAIAVVDLTLDPEHVVALGVGSIFSAVTTLVAARYSVLSS